MTLKKILFLKNPKLNKSTKRAMIGKVNSLSIIEKIINFFIIFLNFTRIQN